jgi:hypothetical protein
MLRDFFAETALSSRQREQVDSDPVVSNRRTPISSSALSTYLMTCLTAPNHTPKPKEPDRHSTQAGWTHGAIKDWILFEVTTSSRWTNASRRGQEVALFQLCGTADDCGRDAESKQKG